MGKKSTIGGRGRRTTGFHGFSDCIDEGRGDGLMEDGYERWGLGCHCFKRKFDVL